MSNYKTWDQLSRQAEKAGLKIYRDTSTQATLTTQAVLPERIVVVVTSEDGLVARTAIAAVIDLLQKVHSRPRTNG